MDLGTEDLKPLTGRGRSRGSGEGAGWNTDESDAIERLRNAKMQATAPVWGHACFGRSTHPQYPAMRLRGFRVRPSGFSMDRFQLRAEIVRTLLPSLAHRCLLQDCICFGSLPRADAFFQMFF